MLHYPTVTGVYSCQPSHLPCSVMLFTPPNLFIPISPYATLSDPILPDPTLRTRSNTQCSPTLSYINYLTVSALLNYNHFPTVIIVLLRINHYLSKPYSTLPYPSPPILQCVAVHPTLSYHYITAVKLSTKPSLPTLSYRVFFCRVTLIEPLLQCCYLCLPYPLTTMSYLTLTYPTLPEAQWLAVNLHSYLAVLRCPPYLSLPYPTIPIQVYPTLPAALNYHTISFSTLPYPTLLQPTLPYPNHKCCVHCHTLPYSTRDDCLSYSSQSYGALPNRNLSA